MGGGGGNVPQESRVFNQAFPQLPRRTLQEVLGATGLGYDPFKPQPGMFNLKSGDVSGGSYGFGGQPPNVPAQIQQLQNPQTPAQRIAANAINKYGGGNVSFNGKTPTAPVSSARQQRSGGMK